MIVRVELHISLSSETYGRNGVTPIFRSFHRTASAITGGWSCAFYISF